MRNMYFTQESCGTLIKLRSYLKEFNNYGMEKIKVGILFGGVEGKRVLCWGSDGDAI